MLTCRGVFVLSAVALLACGSSSRATPAALGGVGVISASVSAANPVAVSPQPGTVDASASTQISFLGGAGTKVSSVRVVGSRSGAHSGVLRAYSTLTGESWIARHPFLAGERVSVTARIAGGSAVGVARTSFTIARQALVSQKQFPLNPGDAHAIQHYSTAPALDALDGSRHDAGAQRRLAG